MSAGACVSRRRELKRRLISAAQEASEQEAKSDGRRHRLVVFPSSHLEKRKAATFEKELIRECPDLGA